MVQPKIGLIWKLVALNLVSVGIVILITWQVVDRLAADYFMGLMKQYKIDPQVLHTTFLHTTHKFLLLALMAGLGLVAIFSFTVTRKMLRSLTQMIAITRNLALGDYTQQVKVVTHDEVGELAHAFNRMVESLEKIEKMRKDLVANVAHELRTPLNNIRGQLEAIQDRLMPPSINTINSLHEEVLRLVRLVEALHRLSQIDAQTHFLRRERVEIADLIVRVIEKEQAAFDKKRIRIKMEIQPISVLADADQIVQVVRNLILNIREYTPEGGNATLGMIVSENRVKVVFRNSGDGIAPEDLPHIFERFYRCEKSRSQETGGAGIGLAIVKQVVETHGGQVGAESRRGETSIWFTLPLSSS